MKIKVRNRIIIALLALFVLLVLSFALTQARYSQEKNPDNHSGELDYTIANQLEVATTEQFFAAIENGYSNIKIADAVSNPFLVSGSADVTADLIMDLNGHQIQRNSREPMLTIKEGVKMIVTDTSKSQTGSFYNPVGSVLKVDGGVLTVMSNKFESGPRDDEYYSNRDKTKETDGLQYIGGKIHQTDKVPVSFKAQEQYNVVDNTNAPIILPYMTEAAQGTPVIDGKRYFVNGNIYFNDYADFETDVAAYDTALIQKDTYIYFTIDDQNASSSTIVASTEGADFHYCYYVHKNGTNYEYTGPTQTDAAKDIKVTIYGYHNVLASARNEVEPYKTQASNFAAIKMLKGSMYARGGEFYSYFGVDTSSCIYADEGVLFVQDGSYTALQEGVAVKCYYLKEDSEFTITGGSFKSFKGDTIQMNAGKMTITGGTFVKDSSAYTEGNAGSNNNNSAIKLNNGYINLTAAKDTPINFYLAGSYMAAIECSATAEINSDGVNFQFGTTDGKNSIPGGNNIGILGQGGDVDVYNSTFIQPGNYSYGIYSYYNGVGAPSNSVDVIASIFSMGGERCTGIYANGGIINIGCEEDLYKPKRDSTVYDSSGNEKKHVKYEHGNVVTDSSGNPVKETAKGISIDNYTMFYLDHVANCYGVYVDKNTQATETESTVTTQINVYAGQFSVGSGYYDPEGKVAYAENEIPGAARLDGQGKYIAYYDGAPITTDPTEQEAALQEAEKVWSAGVYLNNPNATVSLGRARLIIGGSYAAGVFAENGNVKNLYDEATDISYNGTPMRDDDLPTTVFFIGTRMLGYQNGGYLNKDATEKEKKWNHLYKRDDDYYQTQNFEAYYDRIVNCNSTDDYGIAAKAGSVEIGRAYVNVRSNYSRGIYASAGTNISRVKLNDLIGNIDNRDKDESTGKYTVVPKVLTTTTMTIRNGNVEIDNADVRTNGVGIVINNGQLTFNGDVRFEAINATAIYMTSTSMVSGGTTGATNNWIVGENATVSIFCNLMEKRTSTGTDLTMPAPWKLKNVQNRTADETKIPNIGQPDNKFYMLSYNGINIEGGSVTCHGELNVDFHGVNNANQTAYDPYNIPLSGCAINVEKLTENDAPRVSLWHAHVTSGKAKTAYNESDTFYANKDDISIANGGGGISVKGGDVNLGRSDPTFYTDPTKKGYQVLNSDRYNGDRDKLITIETFGNTRYKANGWYDYRSSPANDNWSYAVSQTGGPGIKVESGDITVRHGTYYAEQGNGILLVGGTATVYDGIFKGRNTEWESWESDKTGSGLGSYYGFMLRGGGNLTIHDGTFEGFNGGAFVVGSKSTNPDSNTNNNAAVANVYGGTFEDLPERRSERFTTNGFSVGPYSEVIIGKETDLPTNYIAPKIMGIACGIAVENNGSFSEGFSDVYITVQGGTEVMAKKSLIRNGDVNAIWKGNTAATLKLGECTFLLKQQINVTNETTGETTITEDILVGQVILNESTPWSGVLIDSSYNAYEFPNPNNSDQNAKRSPYEVKYTWQAQGANCYQIVVSKDDLGYPEYQDPPFTVTFDVQGHGTAPEAQTVVDLGLVTKPDTPTEEGWTFEGWYKEADCINEFNFETDKITVHTTIYAKWTKA